MIAVVVRRVRFALAIVVPAAAAAAVVYLARPSPIQHTETVIAPVPVPMPVPMPRPSVAVHVTRGTCVGVPAVMRHPTGDADDLAAFVTSWIDDHATPRIEDHRGVAFVEGSPAAEATRACGASSWWLRDSLRDALAGNDVTCDGNVCCYSGLEDLPAGVVAFRKADAGWTLDAWALSDDPGPDGSYDEPDFSAITRALARVAKQACH